MESLAPLYIEPLPPIDLRHMLVLTDDTSILQHATSATPNLQHGYCTDDTARALIAGVYYYDLNPSAPASSERHDELLVAMHRYLAFLSYAYNEKTGRFKNFMNYDRTWNEEVGSEDSHARALWGLGITVRRSHVADIRALADELFRRALRSVNRFKHIRPWAYAVIGIDEYLRSTRQNIEQQPAADLRETLSLRLWEILQDHATDEWPWWEDELSWGNAKLPHALLIAGLRLHREEITQAALKSLRWLLDMQTGDDGQLSVIGNMGWYIRGQKRARYDQQPIEAKSLVQACLTAALITRDNYWTKEAKRCFEWFTGRNDMGKPMYNPKSGGGYDGLGRTGVSANQGAESTLAYLLSVLELHRYERAQRASLDLIP